MFSDTIPKIGEELYLFYIDAGDRRFKVINVVHELKENEFNNSHVVHQVILNVEELELY